MGKTILCFIGNIIIGALILGVILGAWALCLIAIYQQWIDLKMFSLGLGFGLCSWVVGSWATSLWQARRKLKREEKISEPAKNAKVYIYEDHKSWGNNIRINKSNTLAEIKRVTGHLSDPPNDGDVLRVTLRGSSGNEVVVDFVFSRVERLSNPGDMFFAEIEYYQAHDKKTGEPIKRKDVEDR